MTWVKDLDRAEERAGFLVTVQRKKIWNVELELLAVFDEICQRHQLTYMAHHGTLLGAVRHHGFIPWDDDIDVVMTRPDFEALKKIAPREIKAPYFFQNSYTDPGFVMPLAKLRDSRTTAIQYPDKAPDELNQGIFIDIYPMDATFDGTEQSRENAAVLGEIWATICNPEGVWAGLEQGASSVLAPDSLRRLLEARPTQRMATFEAYCLEHYHDSPYLNFVTATIYCMGHGTYARRWFEDPPVVLPFEEARMPAPWEYYKVLRKRFGPDYHLFVPGTSAHNGILFDPDTPYTEFLRQRQGQKAAKAQPFSPIDANGMKEGFGKPRRI